MPRAKLAKSGLMALREMLTRKAPRKQELVPEDLFRGAAEGNEHAVARIAEQQGQEVPADQDKLAELLNRVRPDRRSFLRGLGQAGASAFGPSPLTILRDTMKDIGVLQLSPYEMMNYSKKYVDRPVSGEYAMDIAENELGLSTNLLDASEQFPYRQPKLKEILGAMDKFSYVGDTPEIVANRLDPALRAMDLENTPENAASLHKLGRLTGEYGDNTEFYLTDRSYREDNQKYRTAGILRRAADNVREHLGEMDPSIRGEMEAWTGSPTHYNKKYEEHAMIDEYLNSIDSPLDTSERASLDDDIDMAAWENGFFHDSQATVVSKIFDQAVKQLGNVDTAATKTEILALYKHLETTGLDDTARLGDFTVLFDDIIDRKTGQLTDSANALNPSELKLRMMENFEMHAEENSVAEMIREKQRLSRYPHGKTP